MAVFVVALVVGSFVGQVEGEAAGHADRKGPPEDGIEAAEGLEDPERDEGEGKTEWQPGEGRALEAFGVEEGGCDTGGGEQEGPPAQRPAEGQGRHREQEDSRRASWRRTRPAGIGRQRWTSRSWGASRASLKAAAAASTAARARARRRATCQEGDPQVAMKAKARTMAMPVVRASGRRRRIQAQCRRRRRGMRGGGPWDIGAPPFRPDFVHCRGGPL